MSSIHNIVNAVSNPTLNSPQEEIREPTRLNMRKNHPKSQIIGDPTKNVQTRASLRLQGHMTLISPTETKHINEAMQDEN